MPTMNAKVAQSLPLQGLCVRNQMPQTLSPDFAEQATGDLDLPGMLQSVVTSKLLTPLHAGTDVQVTLDGRDVTDDEVFDMVARTLEDDMDVTAERFAKTLYSLCLARYDPTGEHFASEVFLTQATASLGLQMPTKIIGYTPETDVIPAAKGLLSKTAPPEAFFCSVGNWAHPKMLGMWFLDASAFARFAEFLDNRRATLAAAGNVSADVIDKLRQVASWTLDELVEALAVRNSTNDGNDELSFPRVLTCAMREWADTDPQHECGIMPFDLQELLCPTVIAFANVDAHSHSTGNEIRNAWNDVITEAALPINLLSTRQIAKLGAVARAARKASAAAARTADSVGKARVRALNRPFSKSPQKPRDLTRAVMRVVSRMANVTRSQNPYRMVKPTYMRPSRRRPDDPNSKGRSMSTRYKPDLHVYLDTSGSISEENYQDAVRMLIAMAKKMNVNLYMNSFSHYMSTSTLVRTRNKSVANAYKAFLRIPKVTGGTDYLQIWRYINASEKRRREFSLIVTDFEWHPPRTHMEHPRNLYYAPCSNMDWKSILHHAEEFRDEMEMIEPNIRSRMLF